MRRLRPWQLRSRHPRASDLPLFWGVGTLKSSDNGPCARPDTALAWGSWPADEDRLRRCGTRRFCATAGRTRESRWPTNEPAAKRGTNVPEKDAVLHYVAEGITRITLNRPQALNARDPGPVAKRVGIPGLGGGAGRGRGGGGRSPDRLRGAGQVAAARGSDVPPLRGAPDRGADGMGIADRRLLNGAGPRGPVQEPRTRPA